MIIVKTKRFKKEFAALPSSIKEQARKQFALFLQDPKHPSIQMKKMKGYNDRWEGRITIHYRFTFAIVGETYFFRRIGTHEIYKNP